MLEIECITIIYIKIYQECRKCGARGDSRYIIATCHSSKEYMRNGPLSSKHTGKEKSVHKGELIMHKIATRHKRHPGHKLCDHSGTASIREHPGEEEFGFVWRWRTNESLDIK